MNSNPSPTQGIWLSPAIIQLKRTPAEKIMLAYLCGRVASQGKPCRDTNKELAEQTGMHPQTASDLVNRLKESELVIEPVYLLGNSRELLPVADLVIEYERLTDTSLDTPKPLTYPLSQSLTPLSQSLSPYPVFPDRGETMPTAVASQPERRQRFCPITNLDITHQRPECKQASNLTLTILSQQDTPAFHELANRFFKPGELKAPYLRGECVRLLADRVYKLAKAQQYQPGAVRQAERATRLCPVSGIDLTHQGMHYPLATADTIKRLFKTDRPQFDAVLARLGLSLPADTPMSTQCMRVHSQIGRVAETRE